MEKSANTFDYEPLPADRSQIRLVAILPGEEYEKVECVVDNFPFIEDEIDHLKYEALSYVWGNATITTPISLNGQPFQVTTNLEAALRALRLQDKQRLIWIDAICINQTGIQERNQQVCRMGDIYRRAVHVIVWLGREIEAGDIPVQGDRVAEKTLELLNSLANASSEDVEAAAVILDRTGDVIYALQLLLKFFSRPWFIRVWILQEIALAKTAKAVYGDRWIGWDRLVQAVDALRRLQLGRHTHLWRLSGAARADKVQRCWMRARAATQQDGPRPSMHFELADLLWQTRFCERTEPRDRLYAILGLIKGDWRSEKLLEIDYTKPVADVFRDLSIFMIQSGMLSHVLCSVTDSMVDLPSWATTWTTTLDENPSPDGLVASRLSDSISTYMQIYGLKGTEPPPKPPRLSTDLRQITIKGRIFDAYGIWHIGRRFEPVATPNASIDELARVYRAQLIEW